MPITKNDIEFIEKLSQRELPHYNDPFCTEREFRRVFKIMYALMCEVWRSRAVIDRSVQDSSIKAEERVQWYAGSKEIARMGPYNTQVEAWSHLEASEPSRPGPGRVHVEGAHVWPEKL